MEQLICHLIGDYWLQNDWMALNKKKKWYIALLHACVYTLPFLFLTLSPLALMFICITHALIDGSHIVEKLNTIKNWHGLDTNNKAYITFYSSVNSSVNSILPFTSILLPEPGGVLGYSKSRPAWLCWLLHIVQDNTVHLVCNYLALSYL